MIHGSCLDCPFRRDSEKTLSNGQSPIDFYIDSVFHEDEYGEHIINECPDTGDQCYGQLVCMKNSNVGSMFNPLSELVDLLQEIPIDRETYFDGGYQFVHYHDDGPLYGVDWFNETHSSGNKTAKDLVPVLSRK